MYLYIYIKIYLTFEPDESKKKSNKPIVATSRHPPAWATAEIVPAPAAPARRRPWMTAAPSARSADAVGRAARASAPRALAGWVVTLWKNQWLIGMLWKITNYNRYINYKWPFLNSHSNSKPMINDPNGYLAYIRPIFRAMSADIPPK